MSKRAVLTIAVALGLLALAQAAALFLLGAREEQRPDWAGDPTFQRLTRQMARHRGAFHLLGTLLAAFGLWSFSPLAAPGRLVPWLFAPLAVSSVMWLLWAARGLPPLDPFETPGGLGGLLLGTVIPVAAVVTFSARLFRGIGDGARARRGLLFAGLVLGWSWAFALVLFLARVAA